MYVLGINAFHADSSACLIKDGLVVNAIEEERIRRIKHWAGFPTESIKFCLLDEGITIDDVEHIAISRDPSANLVKKATHLLKNTVRLRTVFDRWSNSRKVASIKSILAKELGIMESQISAKVHNIEHHRSHMASAYFASPFSESAILSIDGFGDFSSTMLGVGRSNKIEVLNSVLYPHSLGVFYTAFTQFLGFKNYGDEYKVMGLAPYGTPLFTEKIYQAIQLLDNGLFKLEEKFFRHPKEGVSMVWEGGSPFIGDLYSQNFEEVFGEERKEGEAVTQYHKDLASSLQKVCEETIIHILNGLYNKTQIDNICIAGGVAQNSVANGKLIQSTPFKKLYVPSAGHDAGTSLGAALYLTHQVLNSPRKEPMYSASLGSKYSNEDIKSILSGTKLNYTYLDDDKLMDVVTQCLIDAGVVGWFQGRAEFGPRALGNRSILVDPRRSDARELLNLKIKKRESFRPFAPSILKEYVLEYFEQDDEVPFMEKVFKIRHDKQSLIPAVTHVDGTGRLQTVNKNFHSRYYQLIDSFRDKTGIPILLNTSFNENEPIVNKPEEAISCFERTEMDMLVLENFVIKR